MPVYKNCRMESFISGYAIELFVCEVRISEGTIAVVYRNEEGGFTIYEGPEVSPGHFTLHSDPAGGHGTLHLDADQERLEGSWHEKDSEGMWRIELPDLEQA